MGFVIGIIVLGLVFVVGIVSLSHRFEMKKMEMSAKLKNLSTNTEKRVEQLEKDNINLRKRIENLEAIIVERDMQLNTGLDDFQESTDTLPSNNQMGQKLNFPSLICFSCSFSASYATFHVNEKKLNPSG